MSGSRGVWRQWHIGLLFLLFAGVCVPLSWFGVLAEDVIEREPMRFDTRFLETLHAHASGHLDTLMLCFTTAGSALVLVPFNALVLVVLYRQRVRSHAVFWLASVAGAALINYVAKLGFARVRPQLWISRVHEVTFSFPSGHAMQSMAVASALTVLLWHTRWRYPVLAAGALFVLLVGLSRMYFGVHYPSDVMAGWAAALAWVMGLHLLLNHTRLRRHPVR